MAATDDVYQWIIESEKSYNTLVDTLSNSLSVVDAQVMQCESTIKELRSEKFNVELSSTEGIAVYSDLEAKCIIKQHNLHALNERKGRITKDIDDLKDKMKEAHIEFQNNMAKINEMLQSCSQLQNIWMNVKKNIDISDVVGNDSDIKNNGYESFFETAITCLHNKFYGAEMQYDDDTQHFDITVADQDQLRIELQNLYMRRDNLRHEKQILESVTTT